jgi:glycogen operon protein
MRRFVKSDPGITRLLSTRLAGSPDLYRGSGRAPWHSINFVTCHDGFTLRDLVSYDQKHNEANGESDRDGHRDNLSWNCGVEGPTSDPEVNALRARQSRNLLALLFLSQGVPMLLAGDEFGRTQRGNNNAYCQDNDISWVDWLLLEQNRDLFEFTARLTRFRKAHRSLRRRTFFEDERRPLVTWHGSRLDEPDWGPESRVLGMHLEGRDGDDPIYLFANAHWEPRQFELPPQKAPRRWRRFVDTSLKPGAAAVDPGSEPPLPSSKAYVAGPRSVVVLVAR